MEINSQHFYRIFMEAIRDYHVLDNVGQAMDNRYLQGSIDYIAYEKAWIDTVQWHLEDIIRDPHIDSGDGLVIKRRIDALNQKRTDIVELIDDCFQERYRDVVCSLNARHNTESLGWAIDRLSVLCLKEFHLLVELERGDASIHHKDTCSAKMDILTNQKDDLLQSINWLIEDLESGRKVNKVYRQLKMYNDPSLNPVLYKRK